MTGLEPLGTPLEMDWGELLLSQETFMGSDGYLGKIRVLFGRKEKGRILGGQPTVSTVA